LSVPLAGKEKARRRCRASSSDFDGRVRLPCPEDSPRFKDFPQHSAKAYHTMMEALAMAYNFAIAPRMHHPMNGQIVLSPILGCNWQK
jgi:hypothetical protein